MGSNIKKKKPSSPNSSPSMSFSKFGFQKPQRAQKEGVLDTKAKSTGELKVWRSDYDQGRYVAHPRINKQADAYIKKFHEGRDFPI